MKISRRAFSAGLAAGLAGPAVARADERLTVGYVPANAIHWVQSVAIEKGFYREAGFAAEAAVMQNSPHSIQMAITGGFQVAASQPEPFVAAVQRGATSIGAISAPMNAADWALIGASAVGSLADLKGQVIGVSSLHTSESWLTTKLLASQSIGKGDIRYLQVGTSPAKIGALQKGAIGAAVLFQPWAEIAIRQGLPLLARYGAMRAYPTSLYVVNKTWASRGDAGKRVAHALGLGHAWLWDPNNQAEAIKILAKYSGTREDAVLTAVYRDYFVDGKIYGRDGAIEVAGLQRALDDMAEDGEVFKVAPQARKFVLDPSLGAILA
jgi:ABC-type nitrate/sulfonate/bicarbonate transport system substrate-binding protein